MFVCFVVVGVGVVPIEIEQIGSQVKWNGVKSKERNKLVSFLLFISCAVPRQFPFLRLIFYNCSVSLYWGLVISWAQVKYV